MRLADQFLQLGSHEDIDTDCISCQEQADAEEVPWSKSQRWITVARLMKGWEGGGEAHAYSRGDDAGDVD